MGRALKVAVPAGVVAALLAAAPAVAQGSCSHVVILTLPGVTWRDVERVRPPAIMESIAEGAAGSMSVRTNSSRTSLASGFATLGAGARVDGGRTTGGPVEASSAAGLEPEVRAAGFGEVRALALEAGYGAEPGALAGAAPGPVAAIGNSDLGVPAPAASGYGRWSLLAAADAEGTVALAATGDNMLIENDEFAFGVRSSPDAIAQAVISALDADPCSVLVVDPGDLARADQWALATADPQPALREQALLAADNLLAFIRLLLDADDLLLVVSPTSPSWAEVAHLGVAIAVGPGFEPAEALASASTRRRGIVTLPDVAPTVLDHLGATRPAAMSGNPFVSTSRGDAVAEGVDLDQESVFIDSVKGSISAAFVFFQVVVYALIIALLLARERAGEVTGALAGWLEVAGLAVVAFPVGTYLAGIVHGNELGFLPFMALLVGLDLLLVAVTCLLIKDSLDRLLALAALTFLVIFVDLLTGARLQLNTVFGYSPIIAGRFAGAGNIVFSVLGVTAVMTGGLLAHRLADRRWVLAAVAALFALTVIVDGAPAYGSDIGGVLALVPALAVTWLLLAGHKPSVGVAVATVVGAIAIVGLFLLWDLSRPPEAQTHLARLFADVRDRGFEVFTSTIERKAKANLRVFTSTIWTYFVPPALIFIAYLLRRPSGRWQALALRYPRIRAALIGGLVLAVIGFAVNDSGIVIPAVILSFLVPMALLVHLRMGADPR